MLRVGLTDLSGGLLPALNDAMPHRLVPVLRTFLVEHAGAVDAEVLLGDYELRELRRLSPRPAPADPAPGTGPDALTSSGGLQATRRGDADRTGPDRRPGEAGESAPVPVEGSPAGRCFLGQVVSTDTTPGGGTRLLVPISLRAERLGVLEVLFDSPPADPDLLAGLHEIALATAYVLVACGACSDVVEVTRRAEPLTVAAEMQWNLQPLRAFSDRAFAVAGQLIPAYEVGGDCYDYNVDTHHLDLSSMDAMGHGVGASLLAALATAVVRNARRAGADPVGQVSLADRHLLEQFGGDQFVTALLMRLRLADGHLDVVNAGHPAPWLVRAGHAEPVPLDPQLPAGMLQATRYRAQSVQLQPGDRLVLITDGVLEAGAPGEEFGEQRLAGLLLATADLTPHQSVAEVLRTVRAYAPRMHDDATVICLDWTGQHLTG